MDAAELLSSQSQPLTNLRAIFLTCYMTGATEGRNLGIAGYSHDFVARLFTPLLKQWGEVIPVSNPQEELEPAVQQAIAGGRQAIHFSVLPFQDVYLAKDATNIVVPAWEFPDVPDHEFDGKTQNNWPATADRCEMVLVSGPFTRDALRKGGAKGPIHIVPVPIPDEYFEIPAWESGQTRKVECRGFVFPQAALSPEPAVAPEPSQPQEPPRLEVPPEAQEPQQLEVPPEPQQPQETVRRARLNRIKRFGKRVEGAGRFVFRALLGRTIYGRISQAVRSRHTVRLNRIKRFGKRVEGAGRFVFRALLGRAIYSRISQAVRSRRPVRPEPSPITPPSEQIATPPELVVTPQELVNLPPEPAVAAPPEPITLPYESVSSLDLSGVVYTSIFNPDDGRKNWTDLLTGFLLALGDREDATLVVKLISKNRESIQRVITHYRDRDIPQRCKVVFICDFLTEAQMQQLAEATTFYLQATKAEGNCLPLMNYLAAGRPGISPNHSSMGDYFDETLGFVVESHEEPTAWPHDSRLRLRTIWGRIVWTSLRNQIRASYALAKEDSAKYARLAKRCRSMMHRWASYDAVWGRLRPALEEVTKGRLGEVTDAVDDEPDILSLKAA